MRRLWALMGLALAASPALAETRTGRAQVIDGDTLEIAGKRIRMFGIDAPEATQKCTRGTERWACGEASSMRLAELIGGSAVSCTGFEVDQYGRLVAVCSAADVELNRTMVAQGWATAFRRYSDDYVTVEASARAAKIGLWDSQFQLPEDYRANESGDPEPIEIVRGTNTARQSVSGCVIKGNRSRKGTWIYHLPGMPYYNETRAEEIFCSEADAQAAGYRRAIVR